MNCAKWVNEEDPKMPSRQVKTVLKIAGDSVVVEFVVVAVPYHAAFAA